MDCKRIAALLADYSVEALDRRAHARVAEHLAACEPCRKELRALEQSVALFETYGARMPPDGLWNGVFNRITAGETGEPARVRWWRSLTAGWRTAAAGVAAAAAAAALAIGLLGRPGSPPPNHEGWQPTPAMAQAEIAPLVRQHAMTEAAGPFGDRAAWEVEVGPNSPTTRLPGGGSSSL